MSQCFVSAFHILRLLSVPSASIDRQVLLQGQVSSSGVPVQTGLPVCLCRYTFDAACTAGVMYL